jgi:hypothetical protein
VAIGESALWPQDLECAPITLALSTPVFRKACGLKFRSSVDLPCCRVCWGLCKRHWGLHRRPSPADHDCRYIADLKVDGCADGSGNACPYMSFIVDGQNRDTRKFREFGARMQPGLNIKMGSQSRPRSRPDVTRSRSRSRSEQVPCSFPP